MSLVDERIVKMVFDNSQFDSKISSTVKSIAGLNQATEDIGKKTGGLTSLRNAFEQTEITATKAGFHIQDVWLKMTSIFEYQIAGKIVNTAKKIANALTMEGISDGFKEYELKMGSIQTIMAGTGESLATVNRQLEELNKYSDQTIYSFSDMTNNIGKFTNAGVKLEDAVAAIKGIANEAAISGANANEASRAMYNFSQALSAGYVKLIDWKSIENANMATKGFKETLLEVASSVGTVEKSADGMYKVLTQNANGGSMDEAISGTKNFNDSLAYQWMTTEVLTKALKIYATDVRALTAAEKEAYESELKAMGLSDEQVKKFEELGSKATDAASEIKTFSMLMDTLKEAIGSGWAMTWQYIIGDFEQAKSLWTEVGKVIGGAIDDMSAARNRLIQGGLQTGWEEFTTMAGKGIPEAEKYRDTLLAVAVTHKAITKAEADEIDSTEKLVESMHKGWVTGDMLKESVNEYYHQLANLTEEEKKEMGVTEADITQLGQLNDELRSGALSADDFAGHMARLGGRENIIEGLRYAFENLISIIKPIGNAFRELFPATTAQQLYNLTQKFMEFNRNIKVALSIVDSAGKNKYIDRITRSAKGLFAIIDIGLNLFKSIVNAIAPATKSVGSLADILLTATAKAGDFFVKLDDYLKKTHAFDNFFSSLKEGISYIVENGVKLSSITDVFKNLFNSFKESDGPLSKFKDVFNSIVSDIKGGLDNVMEKLQVLKPFVEGLKSLFTGVFTALGTIFNQIGESLTGISETGGFGGIQNIINGALSGGIIYKLLSGGGDLTKISGLFGTISDALETFQKKIDSQNLMNIAKAIGILAASLFVLSMVDSEKLGSATAAMGALIAAMTGSMAGLMKAGDSFNIVTRQLNVIGKVMVKMAASMLILAIALKIVASAGEGGHLWESFAVLSLMLGELTAVSIVLSKYARKSSKGAEALKDMTEALVIMAAALAIVAKVVGSGNALAALGIISIMLGELTAISFVLSKWGGKKVTSMASLIAMAISLVIMVQALKQVSDALGTDGTRVWEALAIISIMLGELAGVSILLSKFGGAAALGGTGAILAAAALLIFVQALKQISDELGKADQHVWQALGVIAASLIVLAVGLTAMAGTLPGAAGLLVASVALIALAGALKLLGNLSVSEIVKSLLTMGFALAELAIGLTLMIVALPGAIALTVAAAGLTILAGALKILGSMKIGEIVKSLLTLFTALIGLGVIATVLGVVSPLIVLFGVGIALLGAGLLATGAGLTFFAAGIQAVVAVLPMVIMVIDTLAKALLNLLPVIVDKVMEAIGQLLINIKVYAPVFGEAILAVLETILNVIVTAAPDICEAFLTLVEALLDILIEHVPALAEKATDLMIAFLNAISENIPKIVNEGYKCVIALINGMADAIRNNNGDLIAAVDNLMDAIIQAITQWLVEFTPLGMLMDDELKTGIMDGTVNVKDEMEKLLQKVIDTVLGFVGKFKEAAENLIGGFIEGFKSSWAGQALQEASDFASNVVNSMNSKKGFDSHSPSKKGEQSGEWLVQGVTNGITRNASKADTAATRFAESVTSSLANSLKLAGDISDGSMTISPTIEPVMDLSNVIKGANDISSLIERDHNITSQFANTTASLADQISYGKKYSNQAREDEKSLEELKRSRRTQSIIDAVNIAAQPSNTQVNVVLEGDAAGVFRLVRQESLKNYKATGLSSV